MQAHNLSARVMSPELQVFQVPKTDTSMLGVRLTQLRPVTTGINPMEFLIPVTETFSDLNRSYFEMEVQLKSSGNANTGHATVLYPVTNMAHSMIKQLSVHVNGVLLEPQTDHYHYKAFFQTILNNSRNDGETSLQPQGWYNDFDLPALLTADVVDKMNNNYKHLTETQKRGVVAMKNLALQFTGGKFYTMFFTPNSPLFHTGKLLVPMQEVYIKMYFNDPSVFMLSPAASDAAVTKAKALSDDAIKITLNLCQVTVAPSLYRNITAARARSMARYPLHASKIGTFSMADGLTDFDQDQLFTNRVPVRVLVGLLHNSAFNGANRRTPFAFEKFGLTLIRMTINGEEYPYKNALALVHNDGSKDNFGYRRLLETMASYQREAPIILPEMWGQTVRYNHDESATVTNSGNVTLFAVDQTHLPSIPLRAGTCVYSLSRPCHHSVDLC